MLSVWGTGGGWGRRGDPQVRCSQQLVGRLHAVLTAVSPWAFLSAPSPSPASPEAWRTPSGLWVLLARNGCLQHLPAQLGLAQPHTVLPWEEVVLAKSLLPSPLCMLFFFLFSLQWRAGIFPQEGGTCTNSLSSLGICPSQHPPGFSLAAAGRWQVRRA